MTSSKILFFFCLSFILGIALQSIIKIPQVFTWGILILGIFFIFINFWSAPTPKLNFGVGGFCILFLVLGMTRLQISEFTALNDKLRKFNDNPEKVTLVGKIVDEPDVRDSTQKLKLKVDNTESVILVTVDRHQEYHYLDEVKVTGNLKTPMVSEDFNYKNYLLKDGIYSVMDFPKIEITSKKHDYNIFSFLYEKTLFFKKKMGQSIDSNFSRPQSLLLEGIILGQNKNMTQDLREKLNGTGLRYLTAISGLHIIILGEIVLSFLLFIGLWRQQAFSVSIIFIWIYIILTGMSASGVRAGIMGSLLLISEILGRQSTSSRVILLAASLMLLLNPFLLLYDVGFQLSFLASMGIIYLKPIIEIFLNNILNKLSKNRKEPKTVINKFLQGRLKYLLAIISVTMTAQIFTTPIMVYNFGNLSLIAPLTNILIVPVVW